MPVTVKRKPLSELLSDLETGKNITNRAVSGQGFDPLILIKDFYQKGHL